MGRLPNKTTAELLQPLNVHLGPEAKKFLARTGPPEFKHWPTEEQFAKLNILCDQDDQRFLKVISQAQ